MKDVDNFVITQHLSVVEMWGQLRNLLRVDANDMHGMFPHCHVNWLPRFTSQVSLDTPWDFGGEQNGRQLPKSSGDDVHSGVGNRQCGFFGWSLHVSWVICKSLSSDSVSAVVSVRGNLSCCNQTQSGWGGWSQCVGIESTWSGSASKLLDHLTTQKSIVAVESCEGSFHIHKPLCDFTGCFAMSSFQDLESELDFR